MSRDRPRKPLLVGCCVLALLASVPLGRAYATLCAAPLNTYVVISQARTEARAAATAPLTNDPTGSAAGASPIARLGPALAGLRAGLLDVVLTVKQSDLFAFPVHVAAGAALEVGRCPTDSTADQWRKAAAHAWADWPARIAAAGLERTLAPEIGESAVQAAIQRFAVDEPWHAPNLARVEAILAASRR